MTCPMIMTLMLSVARFPLLASRTYICPQFQRQLNKITDVWLKLKSLLLNVYVTSGLTAGRKGMVPKSAQ